MAESLAAISLASNILQFVEMGVKLVSNSANIYRSADGKLPQNAELEDLMIDLEWMTRRLLASKDHAPKELHAMRNTIETCLTLAGELRTVLQGLQLDRDKHRNVWRFASALLAARKSANVKDLKERIFKLRDQICAHLIVMLSQRNTEVKSSKDGLQTNQRLEEVASQIDALVKAQTWKDAEQGRSFNDLVAKWSIFEQQTQALAKVRRVIKSLHFNKIADRASVILPAHKQTFQWIFDSEKFTNFATWLESTPTSQELGNLYWICGKAGSGKSTLMKFLSSHPQTCQLLRTWAGDNTLVIASHFFWNHGTPLQASEEGLYKTILTQAFRQVPELVPIICPARLDDINSLDPWGNDELLRSIELLASNSHLAIRLCVFIDGLDEFRGDHIDLLALIYRLSNSPNLKICVSSRPWIDFLRAFDTHPFKLRVQDLTRDDITLYVQDHLQSDIHFHKLQTQHTDDATLLVTQIVSRAEGVFLWVYLIMRSLLRGLRNSDSIGDLHRRLSLMPSDLERYFELMLGNIEDVYRERTSRTFQALVHVGGAVPVLMFYFMDLEELDPGYALDMGIAPYSMEEVVERAEEKRMRMIAQCKDLVYIHEQPDEPGFSALEAAFLHRTVADYFQTGKMYGLLAQQAGEGFDVRKAFCRASLAQLKTMARWTVGTMADLERVQVVWAQMQVSAGELEALTGVEGVVEASKGREIILNEMRGLTANWLRREQQQKHATGWVEGFWKRLDLVRGVF